MKLNGIPIENHKINQENVKFYIKFCLIFYYRND